MPASDRICLISMPFTPVHTPGLGVSVLKTAAVEKAGVECDVYYGALDFFGRVCGDQAPRIALDDYNFIATNQQLGDVLFVPSLWDGRGPDIAALLAGMGSHRNRLFRNLFAPDEQAELFRRIWTYTKRLPTFLDECLSARDWSQYRLVGFSSTFSQNIASLAFARMLRRKHPELHIIVGGANCDGEMGIQMMESFPFIDAVIQGESEDSFPDYLRHFLRGENPEAVAGAVIRRGDRVVCGRPAVPVADLDATPLPDFDDYFEQLPHALQEMQRRGQISLPIETSRGCWWGAVQHCVFCGLNPTTMAFRSKSPERALAEFHRLRERYEAINVTAVDNIISTKYFDTVLPKLEGQGFDIFYETKANLTEQQVRGLARAGVRSIQPGIEGFSSEILRLMKKGVHGNQNLELLKWCAIYHVQPTWFYLYRFPNETAEPYLRDAARMARWVHLPPPRSPNPVLIDRYSPLFSRKEAFGVSNLRPSWYANWSYLGLSEAERMRICYHFEADLPQGNHLEYEEALWDAIVTWSRRHAEGARLYQFQSAASTLIVDTRRGRLDTFLLTDCAHLVYHAIRTSRGEDALARQLPQIESQPCEPGAEDLELACIAGSLGATPLGKEPGAASLREFLELLDREWLAESIDQRWLALAVDCTEGEEAARFGLRKFARVLEGLELAPAATMPPEDRELVQLLEAALR
jgi:ribosomal peptide maturation radical SAM protein 1